MNRHLSIPPHRDLPPGQLAVRKRHLLAEIAHPPGRWITLSFVRPRLQLAAAGACAVIAAVGAGIALTHGSDESVRSGSPYLVQAIQPVRAAHTGAWGSEVPSRCGKLLRALMFACHGPVTLPRAQEPRKLQPNSGAQVTTEIAGGTDVQRALLREIVDATRPTSIGRIELVPSSQEGLTLQIHTPERSLQTLWQGWLIAGAFRDRLKAAGHPSGVSLRDGDSNGAALPPELGSPPPAKPRDVQSARRTFDAAAARSGSRLEELTIYQPDGVAVAATLRSEDPARFLLHRMPGFLAAVGDLWRDYDGVYIRLVDGSGETVWETSTVARAPVGSVGSREDLAGCSPIQNHGPTPPPCPAS